MWKIALIGALSVERKWYFGLSLLSWVRNWFLNLQYKWKMPQPFNPSITIISVADYFSFTKTTSPWNAFGVHFLCLFNACFSQNFVDCFWSFSWSKSWLIKAKWCKIFPKIFQQKNVIKITFCAITYVFPVRYHPTLQKKRPDYLSKISANLIIRSNVQVCHGWTFIGNFKI